MRRCGGTAVRGGRGGGGGGGGAGHEGDTSVGLAQRSSSGYRSCPSTVTGEPEGLPRQLIYFFRLGGLMWLTAISRTLDFVCSARVGSAHLCLFTLTLGRPIWALPLLILVCQPEAGWIVIYEIFVSRKNGVVGIYAFGYRCHNCFKFLSEVFWFSKVAVYRTFSLVLNAEHFR